MGRCNKVVPKRDIREELQEAAGEPEDNEEALLFMDPPEAYDPCIIGLVRSFGACACVAYDYEKVIKSLMKDMSRDEAEEFFDFNIIGAYVGKTTPVFITKVAHG